MPRIYFKKESFKNTGKTFEIIPAKDAKIVMWVGCKKGNKRDQSNDARSAAVVRFKNDGLQTSGTVNFNNLNWLTVDMVSSDVPPQNLPPIPQNGGR